MVSQASTARRNTKLNALNRTISQALDLGDNSPLQQAITGAGYLSNADANGLSRAAVEALTYTDSNGAEHTIPKPQIDKWFAFQSFVACKSLRGEKLASASDCNKVDHEEFEAHRSSEFCIYFTNNGLDASTIRSLNGPTNNGMDPASLFKKGIKRDATVHPVLKHCKDWDSWHRAFYSTARAQGVSNVLDSSYSPSIKEDKDLFKEQQKFMYSVLERCLQSDPGKEAVRSEFATADAQKVFAVVQTHYESSTKSAIDASDLLSYITTANVSDGSWKGTYSSFITHYKDQVRKCNAITPPEQHLSQALLLNLIQNAVSKVPELRAVKNQADQFKVQNKTDISYDDYCALLKSAAISLDESNTSAAVPSSQHSAPWCLPA